MYFLILVVKRFQINFLFQYLKLVFHPITGGIERFD